MPKNESLPKFKFFANNHLVVLITGASSGLGLAIAREFSKADFFTIATARESSLNRFSSHGIIETNNFKIMPLDINSKDSRDSLIKTINEKWGGVDILINNAGICYRSVIEHTEPEDEDFQFLTNYFSPMRLTRLVISGMRKKRSGYIINVSSAAGMMAMPTMGNYSASKFALEGASEALWYELRPWNIKVTLVQPGFINSSSHKNVCLTAKSKLSIEDKNDPYHNYYFYISNLVEKLMKLSPSTPEKIARKIVRLAKQPTNQLRVQITPDAVFFYYLRRLIPRRIYHYILFMSLPNIHKWVDKKLNY